MILSVASEFWLIIGKFSSLYNDAGVGNLAFIMENWDSVCYVTL